MGEVGDVTNGKLNTEIGVRGDTWSIRSELWEGEGDGDGDMLTIDDID